MEKLYLLSLCNMHYVDKVTQEFCFLSVSYVSGEKMGAIRDVTGQRKTVKLETKNTL